SRPATGGSRFTSCGVPPERRSFPSVRAPTIPTCRDGRLEPTPGERPCCVWSCSVTDLHPHGADDAVPRIAASPVRGLARVPRLVALLLTVLLLGGSARVVYKYLPAPGIVSVVMLVGGFLGYWLVLSRVARSCPEETPKPLADLALILSLLGLVGAVG